MWDGALLIKYERPIPGREGKALEVFTDALTVFGKLAADGACAEPEVFHHLIGGGMILVKTESAHKALELIEMDSVRKILEVAFYTVDGFDAEVMVTGEKLMENMAFFGEVGTELGYV